MGFEVRESGNSRTAVREYICAVNVINHTLNVQKCKAVQFTAQNGTKLLPAKISTEKCPKLEAKMEHTVSKQTRGSREMMQRSERKE